MQVPTYIKGIIYLKGMAQGSLNLTKNNFFMNSDCTYVLYSTHCFFSQLIKNVAEKYYLGTRHTWPWVCKIVFLYFFLEPCDCGKDNYYFSSVQKAVFLL